MEGRASALLERLLQGGFEELDVVGKLEASKARHQAKHLPVAKGAFVTKEGPPRAPGLSFVDPTPLAVFTKAQVKEHNTPEDAWVIIDGNVCDMTEWLQQHPGGAAALMGLAGKDATKPFNRQHGHRDDIRKGYSSGEFSIHVVGKVDKKTLGQSVVPGEAALYEVGGDEEWHDALFEGHTATYPWSVYRMGFVHAAIYWPLAVVFYLFLVGAWSSPFPKTWWAIPSGWAVYCVWMLGHEGYHHTFAPAGHCLNDIVAYFSMDCVMNGKKSWLKGHHELHHGSPWGKEGSGYDMHGGQDRQRLFGPNVLMETLATIFTVIVYWMKDFKHLGEEIISGRMIGAVIIFVSYIVRYTWMFFLSAQNLLAFFFVMTMCANYCALLSHGAPVFLPSHDLVMLQMRTAVDLYPDSVLAIFISGALNCHAVHHLMPNLPRSLHTSAVQKLKKHAPEGEYRVVEDWRTLLALWIIRHEELDHRCSSAEEFQAEARKTGYTCKIVQDLLSVVALFGIIVAMGYASILADVRIVDILSSLLEVLFEG